MNNNQSDREVVRQWLATSPGFFEGTSVQSCFLAAHKDSGLLMQVCNFRGELEALGLSIRCLRSGSTDLPASYRLSLSEVT